MRMTRRRLESVGVAMVLATVIVLLRLTPVAGQAPSATAWGHPNLEGIWLDVYRTLFERDPALGDRVFATDEERAEQDLARMGDAGRDRREGVGTAQDVSGAYNAVYTSVKPTGPRTSLVVDPPNGRIPALTAEAKRKAEVQLEWRQALMRNTPTCEQGAPGCEGGEYGPPSPRWFEVPVSSRGRCNAAMITPRRGHATCASCTYVGDGNRSGLGPLAAGRVHQRDRSCDGPEPRVDLLPACHPRWDLAGPSDAVVACAHAA